MQQPKTRHTYFDSEKGEERTQTKREFDADKRYLRRMEMLLKRSQGRNLPDPFENRQKLIKRKKSQMANYIVRNAPMNRRSRLTATLRRLGVHSWY